LSLAARFACNDADLPRRIGAAFTAKYTIPSMPSAQQFMDDHEDVPARGISP
jgi:hypothetical protein